MGCGLSDVINDNERNEIADLQARVARLEESMKRMDDNSYDERIKELEMRMGQLQMATDSVEPDTDDDTTDGPDNGETRVFIANVWGMDKNDIEAAFGVFGDVVQVVIWQGGGKGYVRFSTSEAANKASQCNAIKVGKRNVYVHEFRSK